MNSNYIRFVSGTIPSKTSVLIEIEEAMVELREHDDLEWTKIHLENALKDLNSMMLIMEK